MSTLHKALDIANTLARDQGWTGEYVIDYCDDPRDMVIVWHDPTHHDDACDTVAYIVDNELIIPTEMEIAHEPLVHACDITLGDATPGDHSLTHDLEEVA